MVILHKHYRLVLKGDPSMEEGTTNQGAKNLTRASGWSASFAEKSLSPSRRTSPPKAQPKSTAKTTTTDSFIFFFFRRRNSSLNAANSDQISIERDRREEVDVGEWEELRPCCRSPIGRRNGHLSTDPQRYTWTTQQYDSKRS